MQRYPTPTYGDDEAASTPAGPATTTSPRTPTPT